MAIRPQTIKRMVLRILRREGISRAELSFSFITSSQIRSLNQKFLKRSYATDVLAFDLMDKRKKSELMGDIFISTDAVIKQSKIFDTTLSYEFVLYIVHGILHLLGYDDHSPKDIKRMRAKEAKVLKFVKNEINRVIVS